MLSQLADKVLSLPLKPSLVAYCPSMDLVALALQDEQVQVYRLNGQKVFGITTRRDGGRVTALCWKPDGRALAVAYSDFDIILVSAHTGKIVFQASYIEHSTSPICCLSWAVNFIRPQDARSLLDPDASTSGSAQDQAPGGRSLLEEALIKGMRDLDIDLPLDLPMDLGNIDVENSLPKLSTLPVGGKDDDVFSTRASLDVLFHTAKRDANDFVDVLTIAFEDGKISLNIYDTFGIGTLGHITDNKGLRLVRHCSHPYTSTHVCLLADDAWNPTTLSLAPMDLKFIPDTGRYLPLLASKSAQLGNLVRYMKQTVTQIMIDFRTSQELPRKFMRNVEEDLGSKEHNNLPNAALHLVATGQCSDVLKEWLTDELGERGYRRWEKAAISGYEGVCRYTLQNLLPALDRFSIILSRVRGLSRLYEASAVHGLDTPKLNRIFDTLSSLRLLGHTILNIAGTELRDFTAFAKWLKLEIEVQSTDPLSTSVDEFPASFAALDYASIVDYIQGAMRQSNLEKFCGDHSKDESQRMWIDPRSEADYSELKATLAGTRSKDHVPCLESIMSRLELLTVGTFQGIAQAQRRKVRFGDRIDVDTEDIGPFDMKMLFDEFTEAGCTIMVYVAVASARKPQVMIQETSFVVTKGMSKMLKSQTANIWLPSGLVVQDVKFADDATLICAIRPIDGRGDPFIAFLPYRKGNLEGKQTLQSLDVSTGNTLAVFVRHEFELPDWVPDTLVVNGSKDRRAMCVTERNGLRYKVFDLDASADDEDDDGIDEQMEPR